MSDEALVICGFPGIGKSHLAKKEGFMDSDSSDWHWSAPGVPHPDWPYNYVKHIQLGLYINKVILVSTHTDVRNALKEMGVEYWLCYPARFLRDEYMLRFAKRKDTPEFIQQMEDNWMKRIDELEAEDDGDRSRKIVLFSEEHLSDVMHLFGDEE